MKERIVVVAPHPDDETLGCGGTLLRHKARGDKIYWLIMTGISVEDGFKKDRVMIRRLEIEKVGAKYGFNGIFKLNIPTTKLSLMPRALLVKMVGDVIEKVRPQRIYLPNKNDVHSDHKIAFDTIISAAKTFRSPYVKKMFMYEVVSETEFAPPLKDNAFLPNSFADITEYITKKVEIMKIYKGEIGLHPFPRSSRNITSLATFRGSTAGVRYAEAFMLLKDVW